jgi:hypothetical protein
MVSSIYFLFLALPAVSNVLSLNTKLYTSFLLKAWFTLVRRDVGFCFIHKLSCLMNSVEFYIENVVTLYQKRPSGSLIWQETPLVMQKGF